MGLCGTNKDNHCCWFRDGVCKYLVKNETGPFTWSCGLRLQVDNWESVYQMNEYIDNVKPRLIEAEVADECGEWPGPGKKCHTCGLENNG